VPSLNRIRRRAREHARMVAAIREASREVYGVPWVRPYRRAMRLRRERGFRLEESLSAGLLDPARTGLGELISQRECVDLQRRLSPPGLEPVSEDKAVFTMVAEAAGLPIPRTHAVLVRGAAGWDTRAGRAVRPGDWAATLRSMPDRIVVKPAEGYHGLAVRVLERTGESWREVNGAIIATAALVAELEADTRFDTWIVQERLEPHPGLGPVGAEGALQTVRAITWVDDDGVPELAVSFLKVSVSGGVDNYSGGVLGNLLAPLDVATGTALGAWGPREDGLGFRAVEHDARTGTAYASFTVPDWAAVAELARRTAVALLPFRTLGLDIAPTPAGPRLIEVNMWWEPLPPVPLGDLPARMRRAAAPV
jgi:hypothetical protein